MKQSKYKLGEERRYFEREKDLLYMEVMNVPVIYRVSQKKFIKQICDF